MKWLERKERLAVFLLGVEVGLRANEDGKNLQEALQIAKKIWHENQPDIRHGRPWHQKKMQPLQEKSEKLSQKSKTSLTQETHHEA